MLVRVDPSSARVHVLGRLDPLGKFTFRGRHLYLAGTERIRRLAGIVPAE